MTLEAGGAVVRVTWKMAGGPAPFKALKLALRLLQEQARGEAAA